MIFCGDENFKKILTANANVYRYGSLIKTNKYFRTNCLLVIKGEFQICPRMDLDNILYVEYLRYNNYKNEIILFLELC